MSDEPIQVFRNMEITTVGSMIATTITLDDGTRVRLLADERTLTRQILAYRVALAQIRKRQQQEKEPE